MRMTGVKEEINQIRFQKAFKMESPRFADGEKEIPKVLSKCK